MKLNLVPLKTSDGTPRKVTSTSRNQHSRNITLFNAETIAYAKTGCLSPSKI